MRTTQLTSSNFSTGMQMETPSARMPRSSKNILTMAAESILILIPQIRRTISHPEPNQLRAQLLAEMRRFLDELKKLRYDRRLTTAAHYCLCVVLDETVLKTPWGQKSVWVEQGLLSTFHKETWGGERFYIILRNAMGNAKTHIDLLELLYLCLSLGYEGQYFGKDKMLREEIRNKVFYHIQRHYGKQERALSPSWDDKALTVVAQQKKSSFKKRLLFSFGAFFIVAASLNLSLRLYSDKTLKRLDDIANASPVTMFSQLISRSGSGS